MKKNYLKLSLDIVLVVFFALLMNKRVFGGLVFHEIAGLAIGFGFTVHLVLNAQWIKKVTLRLFNSQLPGIRLSYFLNCILFVTMIMIILSGLMISKVIFPELGSANLPAFKFLHNNLPNMALLIVGIHVGFHGEWILYHMKRLLRVETSSWISVAAKVTLGILLVFGGLEVLSNQVTPFRAKTELAITSASRQIPAEGSGDKGAFKGRIEERIPGEDRGRSKIPPEGGKNGEPRRTDVAGVLVVNTGIICFFAVITYFFEKLLKRRPINFNPRK